jgi:hypothetical protein
MDDMFAERMKRAGGSRIPRTATFGTPGKAIILTVSKGIEYEGGTIIPAGVYNASVDDNAYNCHSYTFYEGGQTKLESLQKLAKKVPKEGGEQAGRTYYEVTELMSAGIHFACEKICLIFPRWVLDAEARDQLKSYRPLKAGEQVAKGDIVMYSLGGALPHSGRVMAVDKQGKPAMIRSKWGHYSIFEHPPDAVPNHYGSPTYYRKTLSREQPPAGPVQRSCVDCAEDGESLRKPSGSHDLAGLVSRAGRTGGRPLDAGTRARFAAATGRDVPGVRVHDDAEAAESARALGARAYTIGSEVVFGAGAFAPQTSGGQRLLAHELTHVIQQRDAGSPSRQEQPLTMSHPGDAAEREADRVARAVESGAAAAPIAEQPLATVARATFDVDAVARDTDSLGAKPVFLPVFLARTAPALSQLYVKLFQTGGYSSGELTKAADYPTTFTKPATMTAPLRGRLPKADATPPLSAIPVPAYFFPSAWPTPGRALVLGGFHGDEEPGWQVTDALVTELRAGYANFGLAFHTIVVPRVNAAAIEDQLAGVRLWRNRCNRQLVDLNRNFPTGGAPKDTDCPNTVGAAIQPEVRAVIDIVTTFKPDRIVSTHAISAPKKAGIFADPNLDPKAIELARGMASTVVNKADRPANRLGPGVDEFNAVYPGDRPGVVSGGTTLGAWAPTAVPGRTTPVITMEAPGFGPLGTGPASAPRTVRGALRPLRAFLGRPTLLATAADRDILEDIDAFTAADRLALLTGRLRSSNDIFRRIRLRVDTAIAKLNAMKPPTPLRVVSWLRLFSEDRPSQSQAGIDFEKFFMMGSRAKGWDTLPDKYFTHSDRRAGVARKAWLKTPSVERLQEILRFSSLPGASRHHWGTEVDLNSVTVVHWQPGSGGKKDGPFFALGQWLPLHAPSVGLLQAYSPGRSGGYQDEPWHYSYAPISLGLRARYNRDVHLPADVIAKIEKDFNDRAAATGQKVPNDFAAALRAIDIGALVNEVAPGL